MRAVRVHQFGGPEVLQVEQTDIPIPAAGQVNVKQLLYFVSEILFLK